jgi:hypothetical protein
MHFRDLNEAQILALAVTAEEIIDALATSGAPSYFDRRSDGARLLA